MTTGPYLFSVQKPARPVISVIVVIYVTVYLTNVLLMLELVSNALIVNLVIWDVTALVILNVKVVIANVKDV